MKKKSKILIVWSMILMMLTVSSICFTIAWYFAYAHVHNMSLTTGSESLEIHNSVFLRTRDGATGASKYTPAKNVKTVVDNKHMVNGVQVKPSQGMIICEFDNLSFELFSYDGNTAIGDIQNGGILDSTTMSWNTDYLTFALLECSFFNQFFPAYLSAFYTVTVTNDANTTFAADLFSVKVVHDTTELGTREYMFGADINAIDPADTHGKELLDKANDNILVAANADPNFKSVTSAQKEQIMFPNPDPETSAATPYIKNIAVQPHGGSGLTAEQPIAVPGQAYSYAFAISLSINPIKLFQLFTSDTGFKPNQKTTVKLQLEFQASNIAGGSN